MLRGNRRFFSVINGGDWRDENSEWVQACSHSVGEGGAQPLDFPVLQIAKTYGQLPSAILRESAAWVCRMKFEMNVERQAAANDRAENQRARENIGM